MLRMMAFVRHLDYRQIGRIVLVLGCEATFSRRTGAHDPRDHAISRNAHRLIWTERRPVGETIVGINGSMVKDICDFCDGKIARY